MSGVGVGVDGVDPREIRASLHVGGSSLLFEDIGGVRDWEFLANGDLFELGNRSPAPPFFDRSGGIFSIAGAAPAGSLHIEDNGDLGAGTTVPDASLHVLRGDGTAAIKVEETSNSVANRSLVELVNNGGVSFSLDNTNTLSLIHI